MCHIIDVMSCLTSSQRTAIIAEIADLDLFIAAVKTAYLSSLGNAEIEEYRFDSGDGSQKTIRRKPSELKKEWDDLKSERARLARKLNGSANVNMNLRRNKGNGYGRTRY